MHSKTALVLKYENDFSTAEELSRFRFTSVYTTQLLRRHRRGNKATWGGKYSFDETLQGFHRRRINNASLIFMGGADELSNNDEMIREFLPEGTRSLVIRYVYHEYNVCNPFMVHTGAETLNSTCRGFMVKLSSWCAGYSNNTNVIIRQCFLWK